MLAPDPDEDAPLEARRPKGPRAFLVDPAAPPTTIEALRETVSALIRERNYLREVRDIQLAEHQADLDLQLERVAEVQGQLEVLSADRDKWKERAEAHFETLATYRAQVVHLIHEISAQRLRTATLLQMAAAQLSQTSAPSEDGAVRVEERHAEPGSA